MPASRPWAKHYRDDPVTKELLRRRIIIPHHEALHDAAGGFLDEPFKASLGQTNTELLGMHHYTVHVRVGIARGFLDDLTEKLSSDQFNLYTDPVLSVTKLLGGFFSNLLGAFDNLAQQLNLVYDLGLDDKASFSDMLKLFSDSQKRMDSGRRMPRDDEIGAVRSLFNSEDADTTIQTIATYRNSLTHRKLVDSMTVVSSTPGLTSFSPPSAPLYTAPQTTGTGQPFLTIASGGAIFLESGSFVGNAGQGPLTWSSQTIRPAKPVKFFLPRKDRLNLLPTQLRQVDLDEKEATQVCEEFYGWTVSFLGKIYEIMVADFSGLA